MQKSYEEMYQEILNVIDVDSNDHEKAMKIIRTLQRVRIALMTSQPSTYPVLFICGASDSRDELGLPEYIDICPNYGMSGFAMYKKVSDYSEPGY
jgi:hypothetical protein